jgi:hypothetical protein
MQENFEKAKYLAKTAHDMVEIPPDLLEKTRKANHPVQRSIEREGSLNRP